MVSRQADISCATDTNPAFHCIPFPAVVLSFRGHFATQSTCGAGQERSRSLPASGSGAAPAAYRDHHGWQWPLGQTTPSAARGRASGRGGCGTLDGRDGGANSCLSTDPLRIFGGELEE